MTYICTECGEECRGRVVDQGIGSYEFWGQRGVDSRKVFVSSCCEAEMTTDDGEEVEYEDPREAQADRIMEERRDRELEFDRALGDDA